MKNTAIVTVNEAGDLDHCIGYIIELNGQCGIITEYVVTKATRTSFTYKRQFKAWTLGALSYLTLIAILALILSPH